VTRPVNLHLFIRNDGNQKNLPRTKPRFPMNLPEKEDEGKAGPKVKNVEPRKKGLVLK
jgi:hypothetical protein